jgi:hypothetical protein
MAQAGDKGILLGDYIKFHAPEPYVRGQLDRGGGVTASNATASAALPTPPQRGPGGIRS